MAVPDFEVIEGKYEILDKLREGGMGAVYKVRHRLLDELRVVKVIRPQLEGDVKLRDRFLREARSAVQLRHPNIATLHDFTIDDDGVAFMVMEFINGEDLKRVVARHERLPVALGLEVAAQTLRALQYLHSRGFVHRDISPDNLMLCRDPEERLLVKLIDLGVAKSLEASEELTRDGIFVGKFRYGAPEQFGGAGLEVDPRTDLYSLGIVLYEVLTGSHPFPGESEREIVGGHLFHEPRDFSKTDVDERLPMPLRAAILRAIEKTPDDRFQSATDFGTALREIQVSWEDPEDSVIELVTAEETDDTETYHGSTQRQLDYRFAPDTTPPPISKVGVVERTAEMPQPVVARPRRKVATAAALVVALAALIAYLVIGRPESSPEAPIETAAGELTAPETDARELAEDVAEPSPAEVVDPPPSEAADFEVPATSPPSAPPPSAPARPAPAGPSAAERRAAALVDEAQVLYREGRDREAFEKVTSALAVAPGSDSARRLLTDLASTAESRAARARREAEAASAPSRSTAEFERAAGTQSAASADRAAGRLDAAVTGFWSSADQFSAAARRAEEVLGQERQAAAKVEADRRAAAEREARERAQREAQAAAPEPEPPSRTVTPVDPKPAILQTLTEFERAHEALDIAAVRALWPSLAGSRLRALSGSFEGAREIEMDLSGCEVQARGDTATARCALAQSYRPKRGTRQSIERRVTFQLTRQGDRWLIADYS